MIHQASRHEHMPRTLINREASLYEKEIVR